uniref:Transposase-associated domain-containing protein n=1 Tax=Chenopodium quinoa TaxID=63459 RepID=A0A803N4P0_CHEQI
MSSWTNFLQSSHEYEKGVEDYLDKAFSTQAIEDQISCPCKVCYHRFWHRRETIFNHLIANGIKPGTEGWHCYEKGLSSTSNTERDVEDMHDDIEHIPGKSKDHHKARLDLQELGIRQELHPVDVDDKRYVLLPKASFSMTKEEKSIFCSVLKKAKLPQGCASNIARYLNASVKKRSKWFNKSQEKTDEIDEESPLYPKVGYPIGRKKKGKKKGKAYTLDSDTMALAHRYVLFNCQDDQVENYIKEHEEFVKKKSRDKRKRRWKEAQEHSNEFMVWFREKVVVDNVPDHIKWLSKGPSNIARRYPGYSCNGYKFYTRDHDERCKTQNSGVSLTALTPRFASSKDHNPVCVVLFECDWFHVEVDDYGLTRVNFKKLCSKDDPFVLASQVHQVFYTQDGLEEDWNYVHGNLPRDFFYAEGQSEHTYMNEVREPTEAVILATDHDEHQSWCREDAYDRVEVPVNSEMRNHNHEDSSDIDDTDWDWMEPSK